MGKLTVTLKPATLEQWKALYKAEQSDGFGFNDSLDVNIRSDAPSGTVRGAGALIWEAGCTNVVQDFLDGNLGSYMELYGVSSGYDSFGRYFPLISVEKRNGKVILSAESGETYYRYLMVWDNDNDDSSRLAQHNLFVTVKVESNIHYEWDVNTTMEDALRNAGYRVPTQKLFDVEMPDGLVEGVDYTYSYDASTGHVSIRLLKSDGWMKAFETCYDNNGYFGITTCFNKPSASAVKVKFYVTDDDDSVVQMYANNDLSEFSWYSGTNLRPGSTRTIINTYADSSGDMQLSAKAGTYWVRCIAVWGDKNGNILRNLNSQHKYMYTVSIEVPEDFSYGWNTRPIEERLAEAGFVVPQQDKLDKHIPGALNLKMPTGLKENTDYTCKYDEKTGEVNITIKKGNKEEMRLRATESDQFSVQIVTLPAVTCCIQWHVGHTFAERYDAMYDFYSQCIREGCVLSDEPLFTMSDRQDYLAGYIGDTPYPFAVCVPVRPEKAPAGAVTLPECRALSVLYCGDYSNVDEAWLRLGREANARGLTPAAPPRVLGIVAPYTGREIETRRYCSRLVLPVAPEE